MIAAPDRLPELTSQNLVAGIDFVYVHLDQTHLDIYFHPMTADPVNSDPLAINPLVNNLTADQIRIYSVEADEDLLEIEANLIGWTAEEDRAVLQLTTETPGDFTLYRIFIDANEMDLYYNNVSFSFKANCPSDLDCEPPPHECPPEEVVDFPVDYTARDFWSFRRALLDFAALRNPEWTDRLEADAGIMLVEAMSALGDEMAYYQDRIGREAYLETATQRRSVRRHARLVDYTMHDGLAASTWLDFTLLPNQFNQVLPAGLKVYALSDNGARTYFEVGKGLSDIYHNKTSPTDILPKEFPVDARRNTFAPHIWDEDELCLLVGTTEMYIQGHHESILELSADSSGNKAPGKWVLLKTQPLDPSIPARDHLVRLIQVTDTEDWVLPRPTPLAPPTPITHLVWEKEQALPFEMNKTFMEVRGNIVPATAGREIEQLFIVGEEPDALTIPLAEKSKLTRAVEREGHDQTVTYLYSLTESDNSHLVWLGNDPRRAHPDVRLTEVTFDGTDWLEVNDWDWRRSLIGTYSSQSQDNDFVLEDGIWRRLIGYHRNGEEVVHTDYATDAGFTIRFGDGEFGLIPTEQTVFKIQYRLGGGAAGNVAADTLTYIEPDGIDISFLDTVTNPLAASGGSNPESLREVRQLASEAFRAVTYRAVRPEDYAEAAERLPWVQRAGATFRWTGSWLSAFVTPDPLDSVVLTTPNRNELVAQLDRFRQAGREAHVLNPVYASIDLSIQICVASNAYRGEVKEMVLETLFGTRGINAKPGYFSPNNFTFGTPLDRSTLEATIQAVSGVRAVEAIRIRRRGWFEEREFSELIYDPGKDTIIRIENTPLHPERGTVKLKTRGGI